MVLTRRAAKKQLEEEAKNNTLVDGCQDAKHDDAENLQPAQRKKAVKVKKAAPKRISLASISENDQTSQEIKESPKQSSTVPASSLADVAPSPLPVAGSPALQKDNSSTEANVCNVVDSWEDLAVPEETIENKELAMKEEEVKNKFALTPSMGSTISVPAFIAALAKQKEDSKQDLKVNGNISEDKQLEKVEEIKRENEETNPSDPAPILLILAADEDEEKDNDDDKNKAKRHYTNKIPPKESQKGFNALHGTRKDHGASTKHRAPIPHHQDIIHPAPAALVEAVQMSADSLQAQLDALTIGPSTHHLNNRNGGMGGGGGGGGGGVGGGGSAPGGGTPYFQRNPETTASVANHLAALSTQLHRLTLCVGTLQQEIAAAATPEIPDAFDKHYLALDTCALMHRSRELDALIEALLRQKNNNHSTADTPENRVSVLVPLTVVRELDGLKESRDEKRRCSARKAISLLSELQRASNSKGDSSYRGQRENELLGPFSRRGDDGILDCLILFKNAGAAEINLVTQDHNFALRAETEGFKAMNVLQALAFVNTLNPNNWNNPQVPKPTPVRLLALPSSYASALKQNTTGTMALPHPPPPQPPLSFSLPVDSSQEKENKVEGKEENMKTPIRILQQEMPPPPPSADFSIHSIKIPIVWTPQPPRPLLFSSPPPTLPPYLPSHHQSEILKAELPQAPPTISAYNGGSKCAAAATPTTAPPATITRWQTENGKLVRPPGLTAKQWKNYKSRHHQKLKRQLQAQSALKSKLQSRVELVRN